MVNVTARERHELASAIRRCGQSWRALAIVFACLAVLVDAFPVRAGSSETRLISISSSGEQGQGSSTDCSVSGDSSRLAFSSGAANLVPRDTNHHADIFVHDVSAGRTARVNVSSSGRQANDDSYAPVIVPDGSSVLFSSRATNLIGNDRNGLEDVFVRDLSSRTTQRISVAPNGDAANGVSGSPSASAHGNVIAFMSTATNLVSGDTNGQPDIFVLDGRRGTLDIASNGFDGRPANGSSYLPSVSADGRFVAFMSGASNLVRHDTNAVFDVFVRDVVRGTTRRVSLANSGAEGNDDSDVQGHTYISAHGRYVAFHSFATNLVPHDTNGAGDVFVRDIVARTTRMVDVNNNGAPADYGGANASISGDGTIVTFSSAATNFLAEQDLSVQTYWRNVVTARTHLASRAFDGGPGNSRSDPCGISLLGNGIAMSSIATDLVSNDDNGYTDIFLRTPVTSG